METQTAYKFRIYPTLKQQAQLAVAFGHARFVWNWALKLKNDIYFKYGISTTYNDLSSELTLKKLDPEFQWLGDAPATCLTQKLMDLKKAFSNFYEGRADPPKFKNKYADQSVRFQDVVFKNGSIKLPKLGSIKFVNSYKTILGVPKMATIIKTTDGKYYLSFSCVIAQEMPPPGRGVVGIDVGCRDFATLSNGKVYDNPRFLKNKLKALKRSQRALERAKKGSNRRLKLKQKISKQHKKISNTRKDFQQKISTKIVKHNQIVVVEDLDIAGMITDKRFAKQIADVAWGKFIEMLKYKCLQWGRTFIKVDPAYTSKQCSKCDKINYKLKNEKIWTCPQCGHVHDRDYNAAINILIKGLLMLLPNGLPEGVLNYLKFGNVKNVEWTHVYNETLMCNVRCGAGTTPAAAH